MSDESRALKQVRIVDLTDERAIYGVKLLADLSADVIRPIPPIGDPLQKRGPFDEQSGESLWYAFYASSRRFLQVEDEHESHAQLQKLCERADLIILTSGHPFEASLDLLRARDRNPQLVVVECSSFGTSGPWKDYKAPDLVAGALGGSVGVTGDADTPPLKPFAELNFAVPGTYVAVAALAALRHVRSHQEGQRVQVPVHQCISSCLEHVFMWYLFHENFPNARARALERRGSLHWTDLYHVMKAKNGHIMVTPTPSFDRQLAWLIEEDAFDDLLDPKYQELEHRRQYGRRMMDVLRAWVANKDVEELYYEAQDHHAPYGWVQEIEQVAANPQLHAREWWTELKVGGRTIQSTGVPYRHGDTPAVPRDREVLARSTEDVLELCGWSES